MFRVNHRHLERVREAMSREERMEKLAKSVEPLQRWERWAGTEEMASVARKQQANARAWLKVLMEEAEQVEAL